MMVIRRLLIAVLFIPGLILVVACMLVSLITWIFGSDFWADDIAARFFNGIANYGERKA